MVPLRQFCTTHKDTISAIGVTIAAVGFLATAIGLAFTVYQVSNARRVLQATNAYQIQKDARDLAEKLTDEPLEGSSPPIKVGEYISAFTLEKYGIYDKVAAPKLAQIFNFYVAVYRQQKNEGVSTSFAEAFARDFCATFKRPGIMHYWDARIQSAQPPSQEMREMKNAWCK